MTAALRRIGLCPCVWYQYALAQMTRCEITYQISVAQHNIRKTFKVKLESYSVRCVYFFSRLGDGVWCRIPQRTKKRREEKNKAKLFHEHQQPAKKLFAAEQRAYRHKQFDSRKSWKEANIAIEKRHRILCVIHVQFDRNSRKIAFGDEKRKRKTFSWWNLISSNCAVSGWVQIDMVDLMTLTTEWWSAWAALKLMLCFASPCECVFAVRRASARVNHMM